MNKSYYKNYSSRFEATLDEDDAHGTYFSRVSHEYLHSAPRS